MEFDLLEEGHKNALELARLRQDGGAPQSEAERWLLSPQGQNAIKLVQEKTTVGMSLDDAINDLAAVDPSLPETYRAAMVGLSLGGEVLPIPDYIEADQRKPGAVFKDDSTNKTYRVNPDGTTMTEVRM